MSTMGDLKHVRRTTSTGARIIVLDTGALINAECGAMLQALQSRSDKSVEEHLEIVASKGPDKFMASFYVGYGHKSIGDCGSVTVFIEDASMLVAKAFQDWFSYCGQEGSTRYMNFATRRFHDPYGTEQSRAMLEKSRKFYLDYMPTVVTDLTRRYPRQDGEDEKTYEKAINARAFDIMRAWLPAGAVTNFSWYMNLRQAADELMRLRHHPLYEVCQIAEAVEDALKEMYPASFSHKRYPATEVFTKAWMEHYYYFKFLSDPGFAGDTQYFNRERLSLYGSVLSARPPKADLPKELASCGTIDIGFMLDFGSFRDLQRHRAVNQRMPLLSSQGGFEEWYISELPQSIQSVARDHLDSLSFDIVGLDGAMPSNWNLDQYYIPMGYRVQCEIVGSLPALVYLAELRATRFVHPTLRYRAQQISGFLEKEFGEYGLKIHLDPDPDRFDVKRGQHDIVEKV